MSLLKTEVSEARSFHVFVKTSDDQYKYPSFVFFYSRDCKLLITYIAVVHKTDLDNDEAPGSGIHWYIGYLNNAGNPGFPGQGLTPLRFSLSSQPDPTADPALRIDNLIMDPNTSLKVEHPDGKGHPVDHIVVAGYILAAP